MSQPTATLWVTDQIRTGPGVVLELSIAASPGTTAKAPFAAAPGEPDFLRKAAS
jgi:hypothetical protein